MNRRICGASPSDGRDEYSSCNARDVTPDSDWHVTHDALACPTASRSGAQPGLRPVAGPQLHERVPPTDQVPRPQVGPHISQLLLSRSMNSLTSWKTCSNSERSATVSRIDATLRSGSVENYAYPAIGLAHQHHTDHPTHRFVGRQERLVLLHQHPAVEGEKPGLPAPGLRGRLARSIRSLPYFRWPATTLLLAGIEHRRQRPQGRIAPQPTDHVTPAASTRFNNGRFT